MHPSAKMNFSERTFREAGTAKILMTLHSCLLTLRSLSVSISGRGLIQQRRIGMDEVLEFEVSGDRIQAVHMLPGYTHNIINLSETEDLVTLMWANEIFDPSRPDTYFEPVVQE